MVELKLITLDQAKEGKADRLRPEEGQEDPERLRRHATFLCDYVRRTLLNTPSLGKTEDDRENMINRGGLVIQTAIDPKTQDLAEKKVSRWSARGTVISTMNMIQPGTGLIIAMAQSRPVMGNNAKKGQTY